MDKIEKLKHIKQRNDDIHNNILSPSKIGLDISHVCTRKCTFCPQSLKKMSGYMDLKYIIELKNQLIKYSFSGTLGISGMGEPTCHPQFNEIIKILSEVKTIKHIEVITNGDNFLNDLEFIEYDNVKYTFSTYSKNHYNNIINKFKHKYKILKYFDISDMILTNRGGSFKTDNPYIDNYCYLPFYKIELNVDGNYSLCCQDWTGRMKTTDSILDINYITAWNTIYSEERNKQLIAGKRINKVCQECNIQGELVGKKMFEKFKNDLH